MRYLWLTFICVLFGCEQAPVATISYQEALKEESFVKLTSEIGAMFSAEDKAIMKAAQIKLAENLKSPGLQIGSFAPHFTLKNAFGTKVTLSEELTNGPVVLVFYRGSWCPYCNLHLRVLQKNLPQFEKYGARLITITPQQPDKSAQQLKKDGYLFEVLSDLDNSVMQNYNLYFELPKELIDVYKKAEVDIENHNGKGRVGLPVPGSFVIDTSGIIRAMHVDTNYTKRMEPTDIFAALEAIVGKK